MAARHKRRGVRRGAKVALVAVAVLALLGGGTAYAAYRYDRAAADRILPGVQIAGIDVGDLTREEAVRAVAERAELTLNDPLTVRAAGHGWTLTPAALGTTAEVEDAVWRALAVSDGFSLFERLNHRLREIPVGASFELGFAYDRAAVEAFVRQAYEEVAIPAVNARFALVDDEIVTRRSREGQELKEHLAVNRILRALGRHLDAVEIPMRSVAPTVPTSSLGTTIVVDVSENRLWLYEGLKVVKEYRVATGTPGFPTPVGSFEIVNKVENPTWTNPDPEGWGAGLPAFIPAGPGNPLGTRALYLDAPGIRIHGTWDDSSIGTAASHGCIRMHVEDSEEMYPLVPVGTKVLVKP
ncbi:MAG TPA: L,D-transpeptidase/peptidoglycan binding protein [Actinomycetota bacterium]|nr:L,D-transpeptidase/peptidoglycan binding protein [Actinomycetota bacterium]